MKKLPYHYKRIDDTTVAYRKHGKGKRVFCFPGWPVSSEVFLPLAKHLKGYELILIDIPGWAGHSILSSHITHPTIDELSHIFHKFIDSFPGKPFALLGYSFGGIFVQDLVINQGIKPRKTVLVSTLNSSESVYRYFPVKLLFFLYKLMVFLHVPYSLKKRLVILLVSISHRVIRTLHPRNEYAPLLNELVKQVHEVNIDAVVSSLVSLYDTYLDPRELTGDTLVLWGGLDLSFVKKDSRKIVRISGAHKHFFPLADHNHIFFIPQKSAQVIKNFLQ